MGQSLETFDLDDIRLCLDKYVSITFYLYLDTFFLPVFNLSSHHDNNLHAVFSPCQVKH